MGSELLLPDLLRRAAKLYPDKPAVIYEGRIVTYAEVARRSWRLANLLRSGLRLPRHARVGLLAENTFEFSEIYLGTAAAECACVPINYRLAPPEVAHILADSNLSALIVDPRLEDLVVAVQELGFDRPLIWLGDAHGRDSYEALLSEASDAAPQRGLSSDIALQPYTSGTTGRPKGAMLSHRNMIASSYSMLLGEKVVHSDVDLVPCPMCHIAAASQVVTAVHCAATLYVLPTFDAGRVSQLIHSGDVTSAAVVPSMVRLILEAGEGSSPVHAKGFRHINYGGSPIPIDILRTAMERLGCGFQHAYGMTEASPNLTFLQPADHLIAIERDPGRLSSVGRESIGVEISIVDEDGSEVEVGERGEIVARGPNVMEGYWNNPQATADTIRDGWLHTGDIGYVDEKRYLYIVDRKKDMLISGGLNVYPREIEFQLERHALVSEAAVIGVPDERWGEVPVAFVILDPAEAPSDEMINDLLAFCTKNLAKYKVPRRVQVMESFPRNATGKVLKGDLRNLTQAEAAGT